jgi:hypothetical protein
MGKFYLRFISKFGGYGYYCDSPGDYPHWASTFSKATCFPDADTIRNLVSSHNDFTQKIEISPGVYIPPRLISKAIGIGPSRRKGTAILAIIENTDRCEIIDSKRYNQDFGQIPDKTLRQQALSKLTDEEKKVLGLI